MRPPLGFLFLLISLHLVAFPAWPQTNVMTPMDNTGIAAYGTYDGTKENINLSSGNLNIHIPLLKLPQRGGSFFEIGVNYDSSIHSLQAQAGAYHYSLSWIGQTTQPLLPGIWKLGVPVLYASSNTALIRDSSNQFVSDYNGHRPLLGVRWANGWTLVLSDGSQHSFANQRDCQAGSGARVTNVSDANDGSFIRLDTTNTADITAYLKDGTELHFYGYTSGGLWRIVDKIIDPNGNVITTTQSSHSLTSITDTVGRVLNFTNNSVSYRDANGALQQITFSQTTTTTPSSVNWSASSCSAPGGSTGPSTANFSSNGYNSQGTITIPTGPNSSLQYQWLEDAGGELIQLSYPTGGYTRYDYSAYSNNYYSSGVGCGGVTMRVVNAKHECTNSLGCTSGLELNTLYSYMPTYGSSTLTTVTEPDGTSVAHQFSSLNPGNSPFVYAPSELMATYKA